MKSIAALAASLALTLGACSQPISPSHLIYHLEGDYAAALVVETAYDNLPDCSLPDSPLLCSDRDTKRKARQADEVAWSAIKEAQAAVRTPGFAEDKVQTALVTAQRAVAAFAEITATLKGAK